MSSADEQRLSRLAGLIAGSPHNLVSRAERARLADVHIPEILALAPVLELRAGDRWLDLGTGGGLPGLVLAIACPESSWTLLDATLKKIAAVQGFADELGLTNVRALAGRAEVVAHDPAHRGRYTGVISRAVAPLPTLVELGRGFLADGGLLAAVKGPSWEADVVAAAPAMGLLALRLLGGVELDRSGMGSAARSSWLVRMRAVGAPPDGYPRRDGVPRRSPLGTDCEPARLSDG